MFQRLLLIAAFALLPLQALADTTVTPTTGSSTSQLTDPQGGDTGLGGSASASTGDGTSLQPAGTSPLQSTTNDSNGLTAPNSSYLQEPASAETDGNLQVLLGDNADGPQQQLPGTGPNYWAWLFICLLVAFCAACLTWFARRNNRRRLSTPGGAMMELPTEEDLPDVGDPDRSPSASEEPITSASLESADSPEPEDPPATPGVQNDVNTNTPQDAHQPSTESTASHTAKAKKQQKQRRRRHK